MKAQQKRIDDLNKSSSIPQPGNSGDAGLVEQVANIVMIRVQADIEMKVQGCVTKDDFDKYISTQEVFSSTLQCDTNDALSRASKAFDDLIMQSKRLTKIDEKRKEFVEKDKMDMELRNFYTPLKAFTQLEENLYLNYTKLIQFDEFKVQQNARDEAAEEYLRQNFFHKDVSQAMLDDLETMIRDTYFSKEDQESFNTTYT